MRTYYPKPSFAAYSYKFKLVNSSFIHAVHLSDSNSVGLSFIKDEDTIQWYVHNDPVGVYNKLTDPTKSVGFVFNNTLKGKQYTKTTVAGSPKDALVGILRNMPSERPVKTESVQVKPWVNPFKLTEEPPVKPHYVDVKLAGMSQENQENIKALADELVKRSNDKIEEKKTAGEWPPKVTTKTPSEKALEDISKIITQLVQDVTPTRVTPIVPDYANTTGPVLHVCTKESTCIFYLALGFDTKTLENVIFYSLKSAPQDVYVIRSASLSTYKAWIKDSLGKYYNSTIKHFTHSVLLRSLAK